MIMQFITLWCMSDVAANYNYNDEHHHLLIKGRMVKTGGERNADYTRFHKKYAHGFVVLCFVVILS